MIICGYSTIGKTTLSKKNVRIIDLDSKALRHLKEYYKEWYRLYGDLAIELEKQGYIVFVSSNIQVIKYLTERNADFSVIIYSNNLKKFAIEKMQKRYSSGLKDGSLEELNTIKENFIMNNNKIRQ